MEDNFVETDEKNRKYRLQGQQVLRTPNWFLWRIDFYLQVKKSRSSPYSKKSHNVKIYFPKIKVILAIFFTFYFVCWSQLPLNMLVSFRRCTKIRSCFCDRKILYTKICNACRFQWNHKDIMSGQIKDIIICLKDVKLQYYKNSQEK